MITGVEGVAIAEHGEAVVKKYATSLTGVSDELTLILEMDFLTQHPFRENHQHFVSPR